MITISEFFFLLQKNKSVKKFFKRIVFKEYSFTKNQTNCSSHISTRFEISDVLQIFGKSVIEQLLNQYLVISNFTFDLPYQVSLFVNHRFLHFRLSFNPRV